MASRLVIPQKRIYNRDRQSRLYSNSAFFSATLFYIVPFFLVEMLIVLTVMFFANDLNNDSFSKYLWFIGFYIFGAYLYGTLVGLICSIIASNLNQISSLIPILVLPAFLLAGFFSQVKEMIWPLRVLSYTSAMRFTY